jgi:raffinose/stachyose/melibiose transport system substrate-binding protein
MQAYYDDGRVYQGPSVLVPKTIPVFNYTQVMVFGTAAESVLRTMDQDWSRLAFRQPAPSDETKESSK